MVLEQHGPDVFVGESPVYPWGRVYGGLVVAHALRAACLTVEDRYAPHSLHSYFIRGGTPDEPIRYEIDRIRNGRSFVTRRVVARQSGGAIFNLSCSFQVAEHEADVQTALMPEGLPGPDALPNEDWGFSVQRRSIPSHQLDGRVGAWLRVDGPIDASDGVLHQCGLAYLSDDVPTEAAVADHPRRSEFGGSEGGPGAFMTASLDHTIWFHRSAPADQWQLHLLDHHGLSGGRGLTIGHIFAQDGTHLASEAQQILLRGPRD